MDAVTPSRKGKKRVLMDKLDLKYLVKFDPDTGRWNVTRAGVPTGSFARDMNTAIGAASREAGIEALNSDFAVSVWLDYGGTRKKVWPS